MFMFSSSPFSFSINNSQLQTRNCYSFVSLSLLLLAFQSNEIHDEKKFPRLFLADNSESREREENKKMKKKNL